MLHEIAIWLTEMIFQFGYIGIVVLMFLESSCFPFPSEIVIIPAGYLAFQGDMDFSLVIFMGVLGSLIGALFNYYLASYFGRSFLIKYGKYFFLSEEKLTSLETYFSNHGNITTFIGRLIPGLRQYISFPAGLAKMNRMTFSIYTSIGAGIWIFILAAIGYYVGHNEALVSKYTYSALLWVLLFVAVVAICYFFYNKYRLAKKTI